MKWMTMSGNEGRMQSMRALITDEGTVAVGGDSR